MADGRNGESFAPELLAAVVTICLAVAVRLAPFEAIRVSPVLADVGVASAIVIVVAFVVWWLRLFPTTLQRYMAVFLLSVVVLGLITGGILWFVTKPGRDARAAAAGGADIEIPERDSTRRWESEPDGQYGTGWGQANVDYIRIHTDSNGSGMITWFPTADPGAHYYAEITVRKARGPWDTACVLIFGYKGSDWWYGLRLRFDGFQFARFEGEIPATSFADGVLPYAEDLSEWHRLAVERHDRRIRLLVDDREVYDGEVAADEDLEGGVTFGTLDIGDNYDGQMECDFKDHHVKAL
jgi:hypothetical protein